MKMSRFAAILGAALVAVVICACNSGTTSAPVGTLRVSLTDAPIDLTGVTAVNVTVSDVLLYATDGTSDEGGMDLNEGPVSAGGGLTLNLLDYRNGRTIFLASGEIPAGRYERLRLRIDSAEIVRDDDADPTTPDVVESVFVPSSKVDVPIPFTMGQDAALEITLDFDAEGSVHVNETPGQHKYILRPVVTPAGMRAL